MDLGLQGKTALITGGSRGIGLACARSFIREGCGVTIVGRDPDNLTAAVADLRSLGEAPIDAVRMDLAGKDAPNHLRERLSTCDVLITCAGAIPGGGMEAVSGATWRDAWELKVFGYIEATRIAMAAMMSRKSGVIVNVIGIAGAAPRYDYICGSVANSALISFTKAAGAYTTRAGVRIVGVNPGATETDRLRKLYMARAAQKFGDETRWPEMLSHLPFGRAALPDEMADLVVFLASARASYLSGTVFDADGGAHFSGAW